MKILFLVLTFFVSLPAAAVCNRIADGSCYNDDYMGDEEATQEITVKDPPDTYVPSKAELPPIPKKKRRPAGGFRPVQTGGAVGDFIEIYDNSNGSSHSRGSQ